MSHRRDQICVRELERLYLEKDVITWIILADMFVLMPLTDTASGLDTYCTQIMPIISALINNYEYMQYFTKPLCKFILCF